MLYVMRYRFPYWCAYRVGVWECNYYGECFNEVVAECRAGGGIVLAVERRRSRNPLSLIGG